MDRPASIEEKLSELILDMHTVRVQATAAHEEARGAHSQAKLTNGRVTELERREKQHAEDASRMRRALFGADDGSLEDDGGIYHYVRLQRRDTRLLAAWSVVGAPIVFSAILYVFFGVQ